MNPSHSKRRPVRHAFVWSADPFRLSSKELEEGRVKRIVLLIVGLVAIVLLSSAFYFLETYVEPAVDPAWAVSGSAQIPEGSLTVRFTGTSTLLFSDAETSWMVDGWFTRPGPLELVLGTIEPDLAAIDFGLARNHVDRLAVVIPVHSHYDHAMDSPEVARRTGALLLGSEATANIGRGWGLDESQIRVAIDRAPLRFGLFTITLIETRHFQFPDPEMARRALEEPEINEPLVPPVSAFDYRVGKAYAIHVSHPRGRFLIQGSAGFVEGGLDGFEADTVFLGTGGLGTQTPQYRETYWRETVERMGASRVIPIHWDSLTGPIEGEFTGPVRAAGFLGGGEDETIEFLRSKQDAQATLRFETLPRYDEVVIY
jgi:L-ascorbate metabolism protein UlaG (beta-lactamase superfamily)